MSVFSVYVVSAVVTAAQPVDAMVAVADNRAGIVNDWQHSARFAGRMPFLCSFGFIQHITVCVQEINDNNFMFILYQFIDGKIECNAVCI